MAAPTLASFSTNFGLSALLGKSLAIIGDARLGGRSDQAAIVERLLSISGEDAISIDRKFTESVTCKLPTRIVLVSNELPKLSDASGALSSRLIILRLRKSWYGQEDRELTRKLLGELPGILLWAIGGWKRLTERGYFIEPKASAGLRVEMDDLSSPVGAFIRQRCVVGPEHDVVRSELYNAFKEWREANGAKHVEDEAGFGRALRAALSDIDDGKRRVGGKVVRLYVGIRLKGLEEDVEA